MSQNDSQDEEPVRARISADLDAPDRILAGLSARQLLVLSLAGAPVLLAWRHLGDQAPWQVLLGGSLMAMCLAFVASLGSRDGLSLDGWVLAAVRYRLRPRRRYGRAYELSDDPGSENDYVEGLFLPGPVQGVDERGVIVTDDGRCVALVACTSVPTTLSTHADDAVLAARNAQWLNSLSGPVQVLLQSRPTDLTAAALDLAGAAAGLAHPDLARAALDHAEFLLDINEYEQPLRRDVLIACGGNTFTPFSGGDVFARLRGLWSPHPVPSHGGPVFSRATTAAGSQALANASRTLEHLEAIGARARILTSDEVLDVLDTVWDPFATEPLEDRNLDDPHLSDRETLSEFRSPARHTGPAVPDSPALGDGWGERR
ncbi:PrgI family protein [Kineosporia babensis]|uniref:PrgI family protein n=1 Tax=Kineosporia babensis TaxID=499548 RepID=A0A9X1NKW9_9ACTN|nr:PrgI family protein [Kineosporia babensis]